jgi:hypothetical protein
LSDDSNYFIKLFQGQYKLVEYYPAVFEEIRIAAGVSPNCFAESFSPTKNFELLQELACEKGGRSGEFVYSTHDKAFIIKTITHKEKILFLNALLPSYLEGLNRNSLMVKVFGVFMLQSIGAYSVNLIIMEHIAGDIPPLSKSVFDLKGSTYQRTVSAATDDFFPGEVYKDQDFTRLVKSLDLVQGDKERLLLTLKEDLSLLSSFGLMDYSLLLVISSEPSRTNSRQFTRRHPKYSYCYVVLIDFLQRYDCNKATEHAFKRFCCCVAKTDISSVPPQIYSERLYGFVDSLF